jgi:hypothetical protein
VAVVYAMALMLVVYPCQAAGTWKVIADSTGVLATHAILLPRSSNVLVWGRQKAVSAPPILLAYGVCSMASC